MFQFDIHFNINNELGIFQTCEICGVINMEKFYYLDGVKMLEITPIFQWFGTKFFLHTSM